MKHFYWLNAFWNVSTRYWNLKSWYFQADVCQRLCVLSINERKSGKRKRFQNRFNDKLKDLLSRILFRSSFFSLWREFNMIFSRRLKTINDALCIIRKKRRVHLSIRSNRSSEWAENFSNEDLIDGVRKWFTACLKELASIQETLIIYEGRVVHATFNWSVNQHLLYFCRGNLYFIWRRGEE